MHLNLIYNVLWIPDPVLCLCGTARVDGLSGHGGLWAAGELFKTCREFLIASTAFLVGPILGMTTMLRSWSHYGPGNLMEVTETKLNSTPFSYRMMGYDFFNLLYPKIRPFHSATLLMSYMMIGWALRTHILWKHVFIILCSTTDIRDFSFENWVILYYLPKVAAITVGAQK
jgi:hypothetical protein